MKKYYKTEKYQRFNAARSEKAMRKLRHTTTRYRTGNRPTSTQRKYRVDAPTRLSITVNPEETLRFFERLHKVAFLRHRLHVNVRNVVFLTPETVLYLLSFLEKVEKHPKIKISGNAPENQECRDIFLNSGFYDFVRSEHSTSKRANILSVRSANFVDGATAFEVIQFACDKLNMNAGSVSRAFYTTILECMGNTKEHAYDSHDAKYSKWWLIAMYNEVSKVVRFAILDNGKGIPATVRKRMVERVFGYKDSDILKSAFRGDFRTSTYQSNRGKGLPKIKSFWDRDLIHDLVAVANNGFYSVDNEDCFELECRFRGTMISWSFVSEVQAT